LYFSKNIKNIQLSQFNIIYSWVFTITTGKNILNLPQPVLVSKGSLVKVFQNSSIIAVDSSGNSNYSDMYFRSELLHKLNPTSNWRFYFLAVNNFTSYNINFNITHQYLDAGEYSLDFLFINSNQSYNFSIFITQCKFKLSIRFN